MTSRKQNAVADQQTAQLMQAQFSRRKEVAILAQELFMEWLNDEESASHTRILARSATAAAKIFFDVFEEEYPSAGSTDVVG